MSQPCLQDSVWRRHGLYDLQDLVGTTGKAPEPKSPPPHQVDGGLGKEAVSNNRSTTNIAFHIVNIVRVSMPPSVLYTI